MAEMKRGRIRMQGLSARAFSFGLAIALALSARASYSAEKVILAATQRSSLGMEQVSIVQETSASLQLTLNSNFLTRKLPARLGLFRKNQDPEIAKKLDALTRAPASQWSGKMESSPHRIEILLNGKEIPTSAPLYRQAYLLLQEISSQPDWKLIDGREFKKPDPTLQCKKLGTQLRKCTGKYGQIVFDPHGN